MSAMDITVQAMSGSAAATGEADGPPTKAGAAFVDFSGGIHLFGAISAALFQRERTGRGQIVEVSMHDTIYPMLASSLGGLHNHPDRHPPERTGNRHSGMALAPYNIYEASDGWLAIICISERHWRGVATAMGRPELIDDPRFRTEKDRVANIDAVDDEVSSYTRSRTRAELVRDLQAAGVPCAPVKSIREVDTDEHLIQRGMIRYVEHPAPGTGAGTRISAPAQRLAGGAAAARPGVGPVDAGGPRGTPRSSRGARACPSRLSPALRWPCTTPRPSRGPDRSSPAAASARWTR
jgi:crotonobetainyl-CoA:carnitine CoA-transferase CaiB-like acyl-CoA transferase